MISLHVGQQFSLRYRMPIFAEEHAENFGDWTIRLEHRYARGRVALCFHHQSWASVVFPIDGSRSVDWFHERFLDCVGRLYAEAGECLKSSVKDIRVLRKQKQREREAEICLRKWVLSDSHKPRSIDWSDPANWNLDFILRTGDSAKEELKSSSVEWCDALQWDLNHRTDERHLAEAAIAKFARLLKEQP